MADQLSELYQDLLSGSYDCVDRIVLNGNCSVCYSPGGMILVARAPGHCVGGSAVQTRCHPKPGIQASFHQPLFVPHHGPDWGHITFKLAGHPPFGAQIMLNGHEYVSSMARINRIPFTKEGNCFTIMGKPADLAKVADTLSDSRTIGRLSQVCERWIYTACLCFAMDVEEQQRSGFRYHSIPSIRLNTAGIGGIDINKPRTRTVLNAALSLACAPRGFTVGDFASTVQPMNDKALLRYDARRAAYDLNKLRAKNLLTKLAHSRRYSIPSQAIRTIGALVILREKVLRPILAGVGKPETRRKPKNWSLIDEHYETIRQDMFTLFEDLRITA